MRLTLARRTQYGIRVLLTLADQPDKLLTAAELAARSGVSAGNIPGVVSALARAGLIASTRGRSGGCKLARSPEQISILEIVGALGGPLTTPNCILDSRRRHDGDGPFCAVHAVWLAGRDAAVDALAQMSLADALAGGEARGSCQTGNYSLG
ncbi:MAG: Rrf2 family transcriptional regulator [Acidimicrobiales bacterium]|jgi:Rrf2 family protein